MALKIDGALAVASKHDWSYFSGSVSTGTFDISGDVMLNAAPGVGDTITIGYDPGSVGGSHTVVVTKTVVDEDGTYHYEVVGSGTGGTWLGTEPEWEPDMTDWPAADILDHFARQLADTQIAREKGIDSTR